MKRAGRPPFIKALPLLSVLSMGALFLVCILCLNGSMDFFASLASFFDSGRSIFFPALPRLDLAWFLPPEKQVVPITWGNIIDIVLLINIGLGLNKIPYDCYRRALESPSTSRFVDLQLDARAAKVGSPHVPGGKTRHPSRNVATSTATLEDARLQPRIITSKARLAMSAQATRCTLPACQQALDARWVACILQFITCSIFPRNSLIFRPRSSFLSNLLAPFQENGGFSS